MATSSKTCPTCGQHVKPAHKEVMSKQKLTMLQTAARHVIATGVNDFKKRDVGDFANSPTAYNNFQKLRYHGLITQVKKDGVKYRERWLITRNAWAFLRGDIDMAKWVMVRNNHIDTNFPRADERISVQDVYRGSEAIITTFEYFDHDTGAQIGFKPLLAKPGATPPEQATLLDVPTVTPKREINLG